MADAHAGRIDVRFDAARLANRVTASLRAYDPGLDLPALRTRFGASLAELGSNENPLGPPAGAVAAMRAAAACVHRYPDPRGGALKDALARRFGVGPESIALGNGSHELLMLLAQCFADADHSVAYSQFGFAVFPIATAASGARAIAVPALPRDHPEMPYGHDPEGLARAVDGGTRLLFVANPNNPTGTWVDDEALAQLLERVPETTLVVVDEAYQEYVDTPRLSSALRLQARFANLIVTRTFSKAWGMAGLRIGYLVADASVVAVLERLRESFNVNSIALAAAEAALQDASHLDRVRKWNRRERDWLVQRLDTRGLRVMPSQTNFVLVEFAEDADGIERHLGDRGVAVRPMDGYGLARCLRISVGTRADNERLLAALP